MKKELVTVVKKGLITVVKKGLNLPHSCTKAYFSRVIVGKAFDLSVDGITFVFYLELPYLFAATRDTF